MKRAIVEEHRRLDALFAEARAALGAGDGESSESALAALEAALAAHFEQEDRLYYPAVAALRPEHAPSLRAFASGHVRFLAQLGALARRVREGALAEGRSELEAFALAFASHEAAEEELLRSLEVAVAASH